MNGSQQLQPSGQHRLGGGTAVVTAVLGLMCLVWAAVEAFETRITVSAGPSSIQDQYPCGSVVRHRPACDASVYHDGTRTVVIAVILAVVLLAFSAIVLVRLARRSHSVVIGVE